MNKMHIVFVCMVDRHQCNTPSSPLRGAAVHVLTYIDYINQCLCAHIHYTYAQVYRFHVLTHIDYIHQCLCVHMRYTYAHVYRFHALTYIDYFNHVCVYIYFTHMHAYIDFIIPSMSVCVHTLHDCTNVLLAYTLGLYACITNDDIFTHLWIQYNIVFVCFGHCHRCDKPSLILLGRFCTLQCTPVLYMMTYLFIIHENICIHSHVYMYIYIHIYVHIHAYIYVYVNTYI